LICVLHDSWSTQPPYKPGLVRKKVVHVIGAMYMTTFKS